MKEETPIAPHERRKLGRLKNGNPPFDLANVRRCGARRKRDGERCRCPAMANGRCARHGGKSTGPRTPEGKLRAARANYRHGWQTKEMIAERREFREIMRTARETLDRAKLESELRMQCEE